MSHLLWLAPLVAASTCAAPVSAADVRERDLPHTDTAFTMRRYRDLAEWESRREHLRRQILWAAGLTPLPEKTPLNAVFAGRRTRDGYTVENVRFESLPGLWVCGNLYRPLAPTPRGHAAVLSPHGHAKLGRLNETETASYQARCITFARLGCVALQWDMIDYNDSARQLAGEYQAERYWEIHNTPWEPGRHERALWNISSLGLQLWNSIRALDFLASLPEVDPARLGCTGESGGGTQTFLLAAVDERVTASAPVCMVSAFMQGGCNCENAPGLRLETNNVELAALMAPRPMILISASGDWTKQTATVEYPALRHVYELYGAADKLSHAHFVSQHGYTLPMREAVYPFLAPALGAPCAAPFQEPAYQPERDEDQLSFVAGVPEGSLQSHEALVAQVIASTQRALEPLRPTSVARWRENRRLLGDGLRLSTGLPPSGIGEVDYQRRAGAELAGMPCEEGVLVAAARGVAVPVRVFRPAGEPRAKALLVHGQGMAALAEQSALVQKLVAEGQTVYAIDTFGPPSRGYPPPADEDAPRVRYPKYFETFNRTADAERVHDVAVAMSWCLRDAPGVLNVAGSGAAGPWVLVAGAAMASEATDGLAIRYAIDAGAFDTRTAATYLERLFIPGLLRAGGLPNAAALLAPHALLLHHSGGVFETDWAADAYQAHGAAARFTVRSEAASDGELAAFLTADGG